MFHLTRLWYTIRRPLLVIAAVAVIGGFWHWFWELPHWPIQRTHKVVAANPG